VGQWGSTVLCDGRAGLGEVKINGTNTVSFTCTACLPTAGSVSQSFGASKVNTGWVLGYGTEGHLALMPGNWTWKVESLYMRVGSLDATGVTTGTSTNRGGDTVTGAQIITHTEHFADWILRGGLNYKFY
jgi:opacity protein-like surface antigen